MPDNLLRTTKATKGNNFILFDSGAHDDRLFIFETRKNLKIRAICGKWTGRSRRARSFSIKFIPYTVYKSRSHEHIVTSNPLPEEKKYEDSAARLKRFV